MKFFCICFVYEMASEVPKKRSDLFPFTSAVVYSDVFYRLNIRWLFRLRQGAQYPPEVNVLHSWAVVLSKFSG